MASNDTSNWEANITRAISGFPNNTERVTLDHLKHVAKSGAVKKWKRVCRHLGVSEDVIAQSDKAYVTSDAFYTSLASWRDEQRGKATLYQLYQALNNSGFPKVGIVLLTITSTQLHQTESPEERKLNEEADQNIEQQQDNPDGQGEVDIN